MSNKEKRDQMMLDVQDSIKKGDIEDALTLLCMIRNAEQLDEWITE